jgi:putative colanic acid biosynthesis glycosyltransferase WcaI
VTSTTGGESNAHLTVVTPTFHPEPIGTPLYATDLCRWFSARGWVVQVVTSQPYYPTFRRHRGYGRQERIDALDDIRILRLPTIVPRHGRHIWRALSELNFLLQGLVRSHRLTATDAVLSISPGTPWVALVGAALARNSTRHICLVHDIQTGLAAIEGDHIGLQSLVKLNERLSLSRADGIVALSSQMTATLRAMGVSQPLDVAPLWSTVQSPPEFPVLEAEVQYSGNFGEKQGIHALPEIARGLASRDVTLRLRGAGPRFEALTPILREASSGHLALEGLVPATDLTTALSRSPVHLVLQAPGAGDYVMPSKVLNALAVGATVIAMADTGSSVDQLAQRIEGLHIVPPQQPDKIVELAIAKMPSACQPETRRRISAVAQREFSRDAVLTRLERALIGPKSGPVFGAATD